MFIHVEISTHCNFTCFYCVGRDMKQEYMSMDMFHQTLQRLPPGKHTICLQGEGEPFLHPDFWEMVAAIRTLGHTPYTITNGSRIDAPRIAENFPQIAVSIDTLEAAEAERIGRKKLARVLGNLDRLIEKMGANRLVVMTVDYGQPLDELKAFVRSKGIGQHMIQPLQIKNDYRRRYPDIPLPPENYTYRCQYLEQPIQRTYSLTGIEYPCCYIKEPADYTSIGDLKERLSKKIVPDCCKGCREITVNAKQTVLARPLISFIVPVKGRLDHLRITLPHLVKQPDSEVVVVDYDCPDGTKDWVVANYPQVNVVHAQNMPALNLSHARNLGGTYARGEWLCFLDVDALLNGALAETIRSQLSPGKFGIFSANWPGLLICNADDFRYIHGYDETFEAWGSEDNDLLMRLQLSGRQPQALPAGFIELLQHDDARRMAHFRMSDKWLSLRINGLYFQIKTELARLSGRVELPRAELAAIYQEVRRVVLTDPNAAAEIRVKLPQRAYFRQPPGWVLQQEWLFRFEPNAISHHT